MKNIIQLLGFLCASLLLFPSLSVAQTKYELTLNTGVGETTSFYKFFTLPFVQRVKELTNGKVIFKPQPAGVLTPALKAFDAVNEGLADAVQAPPIFLYSQDPVNAMFNSWPGGMGPDALVAWMYSGGGEELMAEYYQKTMGLHVVPSGVCCSEIIISHKPLRTADDFKGLKMRTIGAFADVLKTYFDAAPVVMPGSEVYTALERKAIDAVDWSGPSEDVTAGLQEAARYIVYPGPQTNAFFMVFAMKDEKWNGLPGEIKSQIEAAARLATFDTLMLYDEADMKAWAKLKQDAKDGKNEIVRMDSDTIEKFRESGRDLANKIAESQLKKDNDWMKRVVDSYYNFYNDWLNNTQWRARDVNPVK